MQHQHRHGQPPSSTPRTARRTVLHAALAVPLALGIAGHAAAQTAATAFPSKTIRFVVPYPPSGPMAVNPSLYASMPFNPLTDLAPVIQLSAFPLVLEVHPSLGVKTFSEFLAMAKAGKPVLSYASAGNGTPQHLAGELFNTTAGVKMWHIPYRGAGPALNDLIGGQVNVMFDIVGSSLPHIQAGKLIPLAVTSSERAKVLPNVPTMAEAGIAGYQITGWHGIAVRAGTPQATVDKLNATVNAIFKEPAFRAKWEAI